MDAHDIFRKLSSGAKFNQKGFHINRDNHSLKVTTNPNFSLGVKVKSEPSNNSVSDINNSDIIPSASSVIKTEEHDFILLGDIKAQNTETNKNIKIKKEKKKKNSSVNSAQNLEQESVNHFRNINGISVSGKHVPNPIETFEQLLSNEYKILPRLLVNIKACGYSTPTPIQMQTVPIMLSGRQVMACAPTGSGKTAAFLIPIITHLKIPNNNGFRALIVCPTRELARQIFRECNQLTEGIGLRANLISKVNQKHLALGANFTKKCDIIITTPNRLIYLLKQEVAIDLKTVEWLIIDESDKLFEVGVRGFREQLADIYKQCNSTNIKRAMFSATFTHHVFNWCKKNLKGVVCVTVGHRNTTVNLVEQKFVFTGNEHGKLIEFRNLIHEGLHPPVLVFVQSKDRAKSLFSELIYDGINVDIIHSDRTQLQRDNVVNAFRVGKLWVLICTDLMGRGIDFKGVNLVVNYDLPHSAISYIHRVGRTGRAGRPGKAITFFTDDDKPMLRSIATVMKDSGCDVPDYLLRMKKPPKKLKEKLNNIPEREQISTKPKRVVDTMKNIQSTELKKVIDKKMKMKKIQSTEPKKVINKKMKMKKLQSTKLKKVIDKKMMKKIQSTKPKKVIDKKMMKKIQSTKPKKVIDKKMKMKKFKSQLKNKKQ